MVANTTQNMSRLVADERIALNHTDRRRRNALCWAAKDGLLDFIQILVHNKRMDLRNKIYEVAPHQNILDSTVICRASIGLQRASASIYHIRTTAAAASYIRLPL